MLIELHRKVLATDYAHTCCAICGNDFDRGSVYPVAAGDQGQELAEMCPVCLEYLTRRKNDGFDPTLDNWPARNWPTPADLQDARRRYPEPMFVDAAAMKVAAPDFDAEDDVFEAMVVWRMERETV
ncbi:MAG: hypothetical protein H0U91_03600 [Rubrobacter sp.]|nr:hypothetical protein [Rubrobacter sp.]